MEPKMKQIVSLIAIIAVVALLILLISFFPQVKKQKR